MTQFKETSTNGFKVILQRAFHAETTIEIEMQGAMIHSDLGYKDIKFLNFCNKVNASVFFTVKRRQTLPFVLSATNYIRS
jgi:hypothetical protein